MVRKKVLDLYGAKKGSHHSEDFFLKVTSLNYSVHSHRNRFPNPFKSIGI